MFAADQDDTNSIIPSQFDCERINDMSVGDKVELENGNASIIKYRDSWVVLLQNNPKFGNYQEFKTKNDMMEFLNR